MKESTTRQSTKYPQKASLQRTSTLSAPRVKGLTTSQSFLVVEELRYESVSGTALVKDVSFSVLFVVALATAVFVCVACVIGFVGLMVPHLARGIAGPLHRHLLPTVAIVSVVLLAVSDLLSRLLLSPQELPVGVVTTSIGSVLYSYCFSEHGKCNDSGAKDWGSINFIYPLKFL